MDWSPVEFAFKVVDQDGNDLLDPSNPDNIVEGTTLSFRGVTYNVGNLYHEGEEIKVMEEEVRTKAYFAEMRGFRLISSKIPWNELSGKGYTLVFGEIDGAEDMDEDILISWANGEQSTIHYHCSDHREGRNPRCNRYYTLNGGHKVKSSFFTFVFDI